MSQGIVIHLKAPTLGRSVSCCAASANVTYNFRSSFYSGLDRATAFYQDDIQTVDGSLAYIFNDHFTISVDGRNLSNESVSYYAESKERPRSFYKNGRQYYLNLRFNF